MRALLMIPLFLMSAAAASDQDTARGLLESLLPSGVSISEVKADQSQVEFSGRAASNQLLSSYLRSLDASPHMERPELLEIAADGSRYRYAIRVTLLCLINASCPAPTKPKRQSVYKCTVNGVTTFQATPCAE
ncbi:MAG: PilN domain-containing protein [Rhodanobacteraceae bacterium]|nr:PilN domain-containing protein [Rhodanobacteraceae bacterium]